jgi:hypothetical protein
MDGLPDELSAPVVAGAHYRVLLRSLWRAGVRQPFGLVASVTEPLWWVLILAVSWLTSVTWVWTWTLAGKRREEVYQRYAALCRLIVTPCLN